MFSEKIHRYIYLFGLCGLAFGMMIGTVPTSVPQMILLGNWLLELDFKRKWRQLIDNRLLGVMGAVFLIHAMGLFYTQNGQAGWDDVRTKIPLLLLPLIFFSSGPLSRKEFYGVLYCFLAGSFLNTAWCLVYSFILHHNEVGRDASRFMSHIRLGLYLNMAMVCCAYFFYTLPGFYQKAGMALLGFYFLFILYILGLASGLADFFILLFFAVCIVVYQQRPLIKVLALLFLLLSTGFFILKIAAVSKRQLQVSQSPNNQCIRNSPSGRPYNHFDTLGQRENGNYVFMNIQLDELRQEWRRSFPEDSFNYAPRPYNINRYVVLVRYMTSKGLNKDSVGISLLTPLDKKNIRKGICNYQYPEWNYLHKRIYELVCEYDDLINQRNVNGHSLTMRLYFWQAALKVIEKNPVFGVGTGDVQAALNEAYDTIHSPLDAEWRKRPHNQFLTVTVALGGVGLLVFLISIFYPVFVLRRYLSRLYWPFFVLTLVSFILEDTLETQAGLSFYAVFNTLFLADAYFNKKSDLNFRS